MTRVQKKVHSFVCANVFSFYFGLVVLLLLGAGMKQPGVRWRAVAALVEAVCLQRT